MQIGDLLAQVTKALGVKEPCTPCQQRQARMNQAQSNIIEKIKTLFSGWSGGSSSSTSQ